MTETDLAWAAGFIDGEGHIGCGLYKHKGNKRSYHNAILCAAQVKPVPLHKLETMFGGTVRFCGDEYGGYYEWRVYGDNALRVLTQLLPYLVQKHLQAALVMELQLSKHLGTSRTSETPVEIVARRCEIYRELKQLNAVRKAHHAERLSELAPTETLGVAIVQSHENNNHESQQEIAGRQN